MTNQRIIIFMSSHIITPARYTIIILMPSYQVAPVVFVGINSPNGHLTIIL